MININLLRVSRMSSSAREENSATILNWRKKNYCTRFEWMAHNLKKEGGRWHEGKRGSG